MPAPFPSAAYSASAWTSFLSAQVGASAALAGLLFVAVSINLNRILQHAHLVSRAAKALALLMAALLVETLCLAPTGNRRALGLELTVVGVLLALLALRLHRITPRERSYMTRVQAFMHYLFVHGFWLSVVAAGVTLLAGRGGGLYWLLATVFFAIAGAVIDAWVLLVEIQR